MKICLVHNSYGRRSGEEVAVEGLSDTLVARGHTVVPYFKSSAALYEFSLARVEAFFSGIYSATSRRAFARLLDSEQPDLVHINNLFPLISPSILEESKRRKIPTVMTLHNFRLLCPTGLMFSHGEVCDRCVGGREWWCAIRNCAGELPRSVGYAARSAAARIRGSFTNSVDRFIAPSVFVKTLLVEHGYPEERIEVIPYIIELPAPRPIETGAGFVGFTGRISPEKGVDTIVDAARLCPDIPFRFAGHYVRMPELPSRAPGNCEFLGEIGASEVAEFVSSARFTVFASRWYETTGLSLIEAMGCGKVVITSRIGCLPEFVEEGATGLLFEPGNSRELATRIRYLWERPDLCTQMGAAAQKKVQAIFSREANYHRLMSAYDEASKRANGAYVRSGANSCVG